jgi:hypothetical protein
MLTQTNTLFWKEPKLKEGVVSAFIYLLTLIPWVFIEYTVLIGCAHHAGGNYTKEFILHVIILTGAIPLVVALVQLTLSIRSCWNSKTDVRRIWKLPILRTNVQLVHHPYHRGTGTYREEKSAPRPTYAGVFAVPSCLAAAFWSWFGVVPGSTVLGFSRRELMIVFIIAMAAVYELALKCRESSMTTQANQATYKPVEIKEGTVSAFSYCLMLIPWFFALATALKNWDILHNTGGHQFKAWLLALTVLGAALILVAILYKLSAACHSVYANRKVSLRTFWESRLFKREFKLMCNPYLLGPHEFDRTRSVPEPDIAAALAASSCLGMAALALSGWVPHEILLGLGRIWFAIVFFIGLPIAARITTSRTKAAALADYS